MRFDTSLDRCFPGISTIMSSTRPANAPFQNRFHYDAFDGLWTMYMVRCHGCSSWQELRAFRLGSTFIHWKPTVSGFQNGDEAEIIGTCVDGPTCNHCFAKDHGSDKLRVVLGKWLDFCLESERRRLAFTLLGAWERLSKRYRKLEKVTPIKEVKDVVLDVMPVVAKVKTHDYLRIDLADILTLRLAFRKWVTVWENLHPEDRSFLEHSAWDESCKHFWLWFENYHAIEAHLIWVIQCQEDMMGKDKGDDLVDWALSREGNALT